MTKSLRFAKFVAFIQQLKCWVANEIINKKCTIKQVNSLMSYSIIKNNIDVIFNDKSNYPSIADNCHLVAVSKMQSVEKIEEMILQGHRIFGENRVQEALDKWPALLDKYPASIEMHLIGHLQTNKVAESVRFFDVIETLDSEKLAIKLAEEEQKQSKKCRYFIQVNIGNEQQKSGILYEDVASFYAVCIGLGLNIIGLMCIPPVDMNPCPFFALLNDLAKKLGLKELSMGMSADYIDAIRLGATYVRVGTALFGDRS